MNTTWEDRLSTEHTQLHARIFKLKRYMMCGDFALLEPQQQQLMQDQLEAMKMYEDSLADRLEMLEVDALDDDE